MDEDEALPLTFPEETVKSAGLQKMVFDRPKAVLACGTYLSPPSLCRSPAGKLQRSQKGIERKVKEV